MLDSPDCPPLRTRAPRLDLMPIGAHERDRLELLIEVASIIDLPRLGRVAVEGLQKVHRVQGVAVFLRTGRGAPIIPTLLRDFPLPTGCRIRPDFELPAGDCLGRGEPEFVEVLAACEPRLPADQVDLILLLQGDEEIAGIVFLRRVPWGERRQLTRYGAALNRALVNTWRLATARRVGHERRVLLDLQRHITASLRIDEVLERLLDSLADVIPYDAAAIFLLEPGRKDFQVAIARGFVRPRELKLKSTQGLAGLALERDETIMVTDVERAERYVEARPTTRSSVAMPITVGGERIGAMVLESDSPATYHTEQRELLGSIAAQAGVAIENARLHATEVHARALHQELKTARAIQRGLLPRRVPQPPGWEILGANFPSQEMSGDFYDVIRLEGRLGLVVGDVMGKGAPAAMLAATLHAGLREGLRRESALEDAVAGANRMLCGARFGRARFASLFVGILDPTTSRLDYVNAGHDPPFARLGDGSMQSLETGGLVLGVRAGATYEVGSIELGPGSLLLLYTDGITEACNRSGQEYGQAPVQEFLAEIAKDPDFRLHHVLRGLLARLRKYRAGLARHDDVTLLGAWHK